MAQPPSVSLTHDAVLQRLEQVASKEYPYHVPPFVKPTKDQRVNLKSTANLLPVLQSLAQFLWNLACPFLFVFFASLSGYLYWTSDNHKTEETTTPLLSRALSIFLTLAAICCMQLVCDPFFMHFLSGGALSVLGTGNGTSHPQPGFLCRDSPRNQQIKKQLGHFVNYQPTPYLWGGYWLTIMPFLLFKGSKGGKVAYQRFWVQVPTAPAPDGNDGPSKSPANKDTDEAVALDIVFPKEGYQSDKPTFLVLHGLNGGSTEPYVLDLARQATKKGHTVAVMVNRGLMKTPVRGMDTFHGARTSDVGCAVDALLYALGGERRRDGGTPQNASIVMVGFSMGAIIAANYTAKSKEQSGLAGAVCFSGTLCSEKMLLPSPAASRSLSVWQPLLAYGLKATIIKPSMPKFTQRGVTVADVEDAKTVMDIDRELVCKYHGYAKVQDYYEDMSAGGRGDEKGIARLKGAKVPLLAVHAMDDPIAVYEVVLAERIHETENVMLLATKHGGHIGWPQGISPSKNRWNFMMDVAMKFANVVGAKESK